MAKTDGILPSGNNQQGICKSVLIMRTKDGFYPIDASGTKDIREEAADHGMLNSHIIAIEDIDGNVLWRQQ